MTKKEQIKEKLRKIIKDYNNEGKRSDIVGTLSNVYNLFDKAKSENSSDSSKNIDNMSPQEAADYAEKMADAAQKDAKSARELADKLQELAKQAEELANKLQNDANNIANSGNQTDADGAQQAADEAIAKANDIKNDADNANRLANQSQSKADAASKAAESAKESAKNGDVNSARDNAREAGNNSYDAYDDAQQVQQIHQQNTSNHPQQNTNNTPSQSEIKNMSPQQAANVAQAAANRAQQAAEEATNAAQQSTQNPPQEGQNRNSTNKTQQATQKAQSEAQEAQDAANKAQECADNGDKRGAQSNAQDATNHSDNAQSAANDAKNISQQGQPGQQGQSKYPGGRPGGRPNNKPKGGPQGQEGYHSQEGYSGDQPGDQPGGKHQGDQPGGIQTVRVFRCNKDWNNGENGWYDEDHFTDSETIDKAERAAHGDDFDDSSNGYDHDGFNPKEIDIVKLRDKFNLNDKIDISQIFGKTINDIFKNLYNNKNVNKTIVDGILKNFKDRINQSKHNVVDWREHLKKFFVGNKKYGKRGYTAATKFHNMDIVERRRRPIRETGVKIAIFLDTSGSVMTRPNAINQFIKEISEIANETDSFEFLDIITFNAKIDFGSSVFETNKDIISDKDWSLNKVSTGSTNYNDVYNFIYNYYIKEETPTDIMKNIYGENIRELQKPNCILMLSDTDAFYNKFNDWKNNNEEKGEDIIKNYKDKTAFMGLYDSLDEEDTIEDKFEESWIEGAEIIPVYSNEFFKDLDLENTNENYSLNNKMSKRYYKILNEGLRSKQNKNTNIDTEIFFNPGNPEELADKEKERLEREFKEIEAKNEINKSKTSKDEILEWIKNVLERPWNLKKSQPAIVNNTPESYCVYDDGTVIINNIQWTLRKNKAIKTSFQEDIKDLKDLPKYSSTRSILPRDAYSQKYLYLIAKPFLDDNGYKIYLDENDNKLIVFGENDVNGRRDIIEMLKRKNALLDNFNILDLNLGNFDQIIKVYERNNENIDLINNRLRNKEIMIFFDINTSNFKIDQYKGDLIIEGFKGTELPSFIPREILSNRFVGGNLKIINCPNLSSIKNLPDYVEKEVIFEETNLSSADIENYRNMLINNYKSRCESKKETVYKSKYPIVRTDINTINSFLESKRFNMNRLQYLLENRIQLANQYFSQNKPIMYLNERYGDVEYNWKEVDSSLLNKLEKTKFNTTNIKKEGDKTFIKTSTIRKNHQPNILNKLATLNNHNNILMRLLSEFFKGPWDKLTNDMVEYYDKPEDYGKVKEYITGAKELGKKGHYGIKIFTDSSNNINYINIGNDVDNNSFYVADFLKNHLKERIQVVKGLKDTFEKFQINTSRLSFAKENNELSLDQYCAKIVYDAVKYCVKEETLPDKENCIFNLDTFNDCSTYQDIYDRIKNDFDSHVRTEILDSSGNFVKYEYEEYFHPTKAIKKTKNNKKEEPFQKFKEIKFKSRGDEDDTIDNADWDQYKYYMIDKGGETLDYPIEKIINIEILRAILGCVIFRSVKDAGPFDVTIKRYDSSSYVQPSYKSYDLKEIEFATDEELYDIYNNLRTVNTINSLLRCLSALNKSKRKNIMNTIFDTQNSLKITFFEQLLFFPDEISYLYYITFKDSTIKNVDIDNPLDSQFEDTEEYINVVNNLKNNTSFANWYTKGYNPKGSGQSEKQRNYDKIEKDPFEIYNDKLTYYKNKVSYGRTYTQGDIRNAENRNKRDLAFLERIHNSSGVKDEGNNDYFKNKSNNQIFINGLDVILKNDNYDELLNVLENLEKQYKEIGKPKIIIYKGKEQIRRRRVPEDSKTKLLILLNNIVYFTSRKYDDFMGKTYKDFINYLKMDNKKYAELRGILSEDENGDLIIRGSSGRERPYSDSIINYSYKGLDIKRFLETLINYLTNSTYGDLESSVNNYQTNKTNIREQNINEFIEIFKDTLEHKEDEGGGTYDNLVKNFIENNNEIGEDFENSLNIIIYFLIKIFDVEDFEDLGEDLDDSKLKTIEYLIRLLLQISLNISDTSPDINLKIVNLIKNSDTFDEIIKKLISLKESNYSNIDNTPIEPYNKLGIKDVENQLSIIDKKLINYILAFIHEFVEIRFGNHFNYDEEYDFYNENIEESDKQLIIKLIEKLPNYFLYQNLIVNVDDFINDDVKLKGFVDAFIKKYFKDDNGNYSFNDLPRAESVPNQIKTNINKNKEKGDYRNYENEIKLDKSLDDTYLQNKEKRYDYSVKQEKNFESGTKNWVGYEELVNRWKTYYNEVVEDYMILKDLIREFDINYRAFMSPYKNNNKYLKCQVACKDILIRGKNIIGFDSKIVQEYYSAIYNIINSIYKRDKEFKIIHKNQIDENIIELLYNVNRILGTTNLLGQREHWYIDDYNDLIDAIEDNNERLVKIVLKRMEKETKTIKEWYPNVYDYAKVGNLFK